MLSLDGSLAGSTGWGLRAIHAEVAGGSEEPAGEHGNAEPNEELRRGIGAEREKGLQDDEERSAIQAFRPGEPVGPVGVHVCAAFFKQGRFDEINEGCQ